MRLIYVCALLGLLPALAAAQPTSSPDSSQAKPPSSGTSGFTTAPEPAIPPKSPYTGPINMPPEQFAPGAGAGSSAGPKGAVPLSGPPTQSAPGSSQSTPSSLGSTTAPGLPPR